MLEYFGLGEEMSEFELLITFRFFGELYEDTQ